MPRLSAGEQARLEYWGASGVKPTQHDRFPIGPAVLVRVAYWAGNQRADGTFEPHEHDHVTWLLPSWRLVDGYRFEYEAQE